MFPEVGCRGDYYHDPILHEARLDMGWGKDPPFVMDHGVTLCGCSACNICIKDTYCDGMWFVYILPIYHVHSVYLIGMWCVPWDMNFTQNCLSLRNQRHRSSGTDREGNKRNFDVSWAAARSERRDHSNSTNDDVISSWSERSFVVIPFLGPEKHWLVDFCAGSLLVIIIFFQSVFSWMPRILKFSHFYVFFRHHFLP